MGMRYEIGPVGPEDLPRLVEVWEAAVRATHHFLPEADIQLFKSMIQEGLLGAVELACARDAQGLLLGFAGVAEQKLEALFVHPSWHGQGIGRRLVEHAVRRMDAAAVDVNEQNPQAVAFYLRMGFEVVGRSETDSLGKPYPLVHLSLPKVSYMKDQQRRET